MGERPDVVEEAVRVAGRTFVLARPSRPEDLIDEHEFAEDEFLPYWAELWPSALALAEALAARDLTGVRVLELGCGLGLAAVAAAARGADVLATDWSDEALRATAANAARNRVAVATALWRWTDDPSALGPPFDLVVGSDLLYERRNGPWLLDALPALLGQGSEVWIADPGRSTAGGFLEAAVGAYDLAALAHPGPRSVTVHRLRRR